MEAELEARRLRLFKYLSGEFRRGGSEARVPVSDHYIYPSLYQPSRGNETRGLDCFYLSSEEPKQDVELNCEESYSLLVFMWPRTDTT